MCISSWLVCVLAVLCSVRAYLLIDYVITQPLMRVRAGACA